MIVRMVHFSKTKKQMILSVQLQAFLHCLHMKNGNVNTAIHHATSSNLDKRGMGDIWVMTIEEYVEASKWQRFAYRLYRNPIVMFGFGPIYLVLISSRFNRKMHVKKSETIRI